MGFPENLAALKEKLAEVPELTPAQRDVLTSDAMISRIMPLMTAFVTENVTKTQEAKDKTTETMREFINKMLLEPIQPRDTKKFLSDIGNGLFDASFLDETVREINDHWLWGLVPSMVIAAVHIATTAYNYLSVSSERTRQIANQDIQPYLLDLDTLTEEWFRKPQNYAWVREQMRKMGIADTKIDVFFDNRKNLLPLEFLRILWHREILPENDIDTGLAKLRFNPDDIPAVKEALKAYPGVQDLVTFAVREVFDEAFVRSAGLLSDMPSAFREEAKMTGLPEKYIDMFWAAHWRPPSTGEAFEMFQRRVIDENELNVLLRIQDHMPAYREKLTKIAYNPITRVDIRRIYQDEVIDYEEMVTRYRDTGYSPENAELLSDWTEIRYGEEQKERTKADITNLYKLGVYDQAESTQLLQEIGYSGDLASELLYRIDITEAEKDKNNRLKIWKKGFVNRVYTEIQARNFMVLYGIQKREIDGLIAEWQIDLETKVIDLSKDDIRLLFQKDVINYADALDRMVLNGYRVIDAELLLTLWGLGKKG